MMLGNGVHRRIVASTLSEIRGALSLAQEGTLDEVRLFSMHLSRIDIADSRKQCLYGIPIYPSALPHLSAISKEIKMLLMVDNVQQIEHLENFSRNNPTVSSWPVFIKVDLGYHRAGLETSSPLFLDLLKKVEESSATSLYGFYCHAGNSYGCRTTEAAEKVLQDEVDGVVKAVRILESANPNTKKDRKLVVSVGSTPTAHVANSLKESLPEGVELELHAGSYYSSVKINDGPLLTNVQEITLPMISNKYAPNSSLNPSRRCASSQKSAVFTRNATKPSSTQARLLYRRKPVTRQAMAV